MTKTNTTTNNTALYQKGDRLGKILSEWRNNAVLREIRGVFVDLACGDNILVRIHGSGTGVDIKDYGHANLVLDNFHALPFEDRSVDTVTIVASLNYFPEPVLVLQEVQRILKDDGQLVITMSNYSVMKIWHKFRESWAHKPGYSYQQIRDLMAQAGLKVVKRKPFMLFMNYVYIIQKTDQA